MKFIFLSGGVAGFLTGGLTSLSSDHSPQRTLLDAAIGCLLGAILFRWFWSILVGGIRETLVLRRDAADAEAAAAAAARSPKQK
jgi:hypothetical protein